MVRFLPSQSIINAVRNNAETNIRIVNKMYQENVIAHFWYNVIKSRIINEESDQRIKRKTKTYE